MTLEKLADALLEEALKRYEDGGWDVVVECWTRDEIVQRWRDDVSDFKVALPTTVAEAVESFRPLAEVWADRQADARNSAF